MRVRFTYQRIRTFQDTRTVDFEAADMLEAYRLASAYERRDPWGMAKPTATSETTPDSPTLSQWWLSSALPVSTEANNRG